MLLVGVVDRKITARFSMVLLMRERVAGWVFVDWCGAGGSRSFSPFQEKRAEAGGM